MSYLKVKEEYENTSISFAKLSKKHNIHYKRIEREAKKNNWIKFDPTNAQKAITIAPQIQDIEDIEQSFLESIELEISLLHDELMTNAIHQKDLVTIDSYMLSYKLFKAYENEIDFNNLATIPVFYLQQIQIQQNNLTRLGKEIREMQWRNKL